MSEPRRLMAVLAHPDDESLGIGGVLALYAARGVEITIVTATRGERGRFFDNSNRPPDDEVGRVREGELREAAAILGATNVVVLDHGDGALDRVPPDEIVARIAAEMRRARPHVVVTFDPFGAYGHPDHVAISQFTSAAVVAAADGGGPAGGLPPHAVAKLYCFVSDAEAWERYQAAFKRLTSAADGVVREAHIWPAWSISARVDASDHWETVWRAVQCHRTQLTGYGPTIMSLTDAQHRILWGAQSFYRLMSRVNGGRTMEQDLFEGIG